MAMNECSADFCKSIAVYLVSFVVEQTWASRRDDRSWRHILEDSLYCRSNVPNLYAIEINKMR